MYLIAIKTFLYNFTMGSVYVLNDGSLTDADLELIKRHVPNITIKHINEIDTTGFPTGNTWERLLYYIELSKDAYVIQIDTDTLTFKPMMDIHAAINDNRGFIIGNGPAWEMPVHVEYMSNIIKSWSPEPRNDHIQLASEHIFPDLPFFEGYKDYFRGCSGFTGLPKGQITKQMLKDFSQQVIYEIGEKKWYEWGSEQVACSVMISRTHNPLILPWQMYQNYGFPSIHTKSVITASLVHFIGTYRFNNSCYYKHAMQFIKSIQH
jgi:hypothetical protein